MAGYNRGIVATRKLNENNKARLGRGNDTEIRKVDGEKSHVNAFEAYLIDVYGKAGEKFAQEVGAGTRNPLTGLKEYDIGNVFSAAGRKHNKLHLESGMSGGAIPSPHDLGTEYKEEGVGGESAGLTTEVDETKQAMWGEEKTYDEIKLMDPDDRTEYLKSFGLSEEDMGLVSGFQDEPFDFLKQERTATFKEIGLGERGLESTRDLTLKGIGLGERGLASTRDLTLEGLTGQQQALGRTTGRGLSGARDVQSANIRRSGLATSGTITQGYEKQKQELLQDYTAGTQDIGRQRRGALADYGFGMEGYGVERETAAADYGFGMEGFGIERKRMQTTYDKGTYLEEQRQLEDFYGDITGIKQFT